MHFEGESYEIKCDFAAGSLFSHWPGLADAEGHPSPHPVSSCSGLGLFLPSDSPTQEPGLCSLLRAFPALWNLLSLVQCSPSAENLTVVGHTSPLVAGGSGCWDDCRLPSMWPLRRCFHVSNLLIGTPSFGFPPSDFCSQSLTSPPALRPLSLVCFGGLV